jgi:hypothetical protein
MALTVYGTDSSKYMIDEGKKSVSYEAVKNPFAVATAPSARGLPYPTIPTAIFCYIAAIILTEMDSVKIQN